MINRTEILEILKGYNKKNIRIGTVSSHSALDTYDGAKEEGFQTLAVTQRGRDSTYTKYYKSQYDQNGKLVRGVVDEFWQFERFNEVLLPENQKKLVETNTIFIPNRAFSSYCSIDAIENDFRVPMFGSRDMLRSEERGEKQDYYWLLEKAGLPFPKKIEDPQDIDHLCIVKLHHAKKKLERGFFTAASFEEYEEKAKELLEQGVITQDALDNARIEEYIIGPVFNFNFFYSPLETEMPKLELLAVDWRFESSLDGHVRLPAEQQLRLGGTQKTPEYTVCGHNSATVRESLIGPAYELAEKYVKASQEHYELGIIGPFCLQTCVDKDLKPYIYDVAPRIGGGTNVHISMGHPYSNMLWRKPVSTGRRTAMEIRRGIEEDRLDEIMT